MRTSGAPTEYRMTIAIGVIALLVASVMAGGPMELLHALERGLRAGAAALHAAWLSFTG